MSAKEIGFPMAQAHPGVERNRRKGADLARFDRETNSVKQNWAPTFGHRYQHILANKPPWGVRRINTQHASQRQEQVDFQR